MTKLFNAAQRAAIDNAYRTGREQASTGVFIEVASQAFIQALPTAYEGQEEDDYGDFVDWANEQFLCGFAMARSKARHREHAGHSCWPEVVRDVQKDLKHGPANAVAKLLSTERAMAVHWWTILNQLTLRKLLPADVGRDAGSSPDNDRWWRACAETDAALIGLRAISRTRYGARLGTSWRPVLIRW